MVLKHLLISCENSKKRMGELMKYVHCLNSISKVGLKELPKNYEVSPKLDEATAVLVRSAVMHEMELPSSVRAVGRAGAGVNNIPLDLYAKKGVVVFNTPGANANAVKELTLAGMLLASRDIVGGIGWIKDHKEDQEISKSVEKAKAQFGGTEIKGKTIGIIGLGAIGMELARSCAALGMKVIGTKRDLSTIDKLDIPENMVLVKTIEEMLPNADFISLNVPLNPQTKYMINEKMFSMMKDGVILINGARDQLVNDQDLRVAIESKKVRCYVTDFPNPETANMPNVIAIPHLGASTEEAEDNCAFMAVHQIVDYLECGNIKNSVNFPDACLGKIKNHRITILGDLNLDEHQTIDMIGHEEILDKTIQKNKSYSTMIVDTKKALSHQLIQKISEQASVYYIHQI